MKILIYPVLLGLSCHFAFGANRNHLVKSDTAVLFSQHDSVSIAPVLKNNDAALIIKGNERLLSNLVIFYNHFASKGSPKQAEETLLKKSIPLALRFGNHRTIYNCFMALAQCYVEQKKYSQAKWYFIQSTLSAQKAKYPKGEVLSLIQLSKLKRLIGDEQLAFDDMKQAEQLALKHNFKASLPDIQKILASFPQSDKKEKTEKIIELAQKQTLADPD